ncbi:hypothetical protein Bca52824_002363 [Brassica carinata]|uniref:Uncharacterized protein n=1 Tax=Brassica carinata TaxID=52824 RepID=A0A8X7WN85_BRACI|nr:hypothetical protein Bca52824_002363 [Brassica carinata]
MVIFAFDDDMIVGAITRPKAWPYVKAVGADILFRVRKIKWHFAILISQSVTVDGRTQSYVAAGYSFWLQDVFENEKRLVSF